VALGALLPIRLVVCGLLEFGGHGHLVLADRVELLQSVRVHTPLRGGSVNEELGGQLFTSAGNSTRVCVYGELLRKSAHCFVCREELSVDGVVDHQTSRGVRLKLLVRDATFVGAGSGWLGCRQIESLTTHLNLYLLHVPRYPSK